MNDRTFRHVVALAEPSESGTSEVQLLRAGTYKHPMFSAFKIDDALLGRLVNNFESRARGVDIAVDVDHDRGEAQGWFTALRLTEGGELWGAVEWTPAGRQKVADRLYRYMSVEYDGEFSDTDGVEHGATLLGAALTNRPFIKDMAPVTLSEPVIEEEMEMAELLNIATALGLADDADEQSILDAIKALRAAQTDSASDTNTAALTEATARNVALSEQNASLSARLDRLETQRRNGEIKRLMEAGRLTPAMLDASGGHLRKYAESDLDGFVAFVEALPVTVSLTERGSSGDGNDTIAAFNAAVEAATTGGRTYADALREVARTKPDLVKAYREASANRV